MSCRDETTVAPAFRPCSVVPADTLSVPVMVVLFAANVETVAAPVFSVPVVTIFCDPKFGTTLEPSIDADDEISASISKLLVKSPLELLWTKPATVNFPTVIVVGLVNVVLPLMVTFPVPVVNVPVPNTLTAGL